jgi:ribosome biogenesis GTPase
MAIAEYTLQDLGWDDSFVEAFAELKEPDHIAARVAIEHRKSYLVYTPGGDFGATISGRLAHTARYEAELPKVGDWVTVSRPDEVGPAIIHNVLKRRNSFGRKAPGKPQDEQVLAANVDVVFIVQGLDRGFNPRSLERYLVTVRESGVEPITVLNKTDISSEVSLVLSQAESVAPGTRVIATSALTAEGVDSLRPLLLPRKTYAFVGPSGVGKSTLINRMLGREAQITREVRLIDAKGMHATTHRELLMMPGGSLLIDTPGMRAFQLWGGIEGLNEVFPDIHELGVNCRFRDCSHTVEAGCAVLEAAESGKLNPERLLSYQKLSKELEYQKSKWDATARREKQRRSRELGRAINRYHQRKNDNDK